MKKIQLITCMLIIAITSLLTTTAFADELTGHGHEEGLRYLIVKDALIQDANGNYNPNRNVTRGEFARYLTKALNLQTTSDKQFSDVPSTSIYAEDIQRAVAAGIITGYEDATFRPETSISRVHMAVMLNRAITYLKLEKGTDVVTFKDQNLIYKDYYEAVSIGASLEIIQGNNGYFMPQKNATIAQSASFIYRLMTLAEDPDTNLVKYEIHTISNGELVKGKTFYDYDEALATLTTDAQVIVSNDKIIKMSSGYVVTNKYSVISSETSKDQIGFSGSTEMEYLGSDATTATVRFAGQKGTLSLNNVTLIPFSLSKGRSYYTNENGEIKHVLINQTTGKVSGSYTYGKAPSFMTVNGKYYSWNGISFTNSNGNYVGDAYNYYQFLPARSTTKYTAEELDSYIMNKLTALENSGSSLYANATTKSKIIGLGKIAKDIEAKYQINAMLILSLAQHESSYGMSEHAQKYNNLFGLYVYDTNPLNKEFDSVQANVQELVEKFWQPNYITPNKNFANGAIAGTKALGFNVKYASDPFWGAKLAGHYYRIDKELGFKDVMNPYTIGLTTTTGLKIRTVATTYQNTPLFIYEKSNIPVIITSSNLNGWYEIISDLYYKDRVYVSKSYVKAINTVK